MQLLPLRSGSSCVLQIAQQPATYSFDYFINYTNPNQYVSKLNGSGHKIGPGIVLKVMAGDRFHLRANSWYKTWGATPTNTPNPLTDLVTALAGGIAGAGSKISAEELTGSGALSPGALAFLTYQDNLDNEIKPLAFVNWVLFDEQFRFVEGSSGFEQVGNNLEFKTHVRNDLPISKSGYLYVYCSNETANIDVFFDNLQVTHVRGPLVEETHYYPWGLTMAGISSKAMKSNYPENQKKYNGIEHTTDFDLNTYDVFYRSLDPQTGRWWQIDPKIESMEMWSPYVSNYNNPIRYEDFLGNEPDPPGWAQKLFELTKDVAKKSVIFVAGAANAWSSNQLLGAALRYAFFGNPQEFVSYNEFLDMHNYSVDDAQDIFREYYEQYLTETDLNSDYAFIRYDLDYGNYRPLIHASSHLHIGLSEHIRIPVDKVLTPLAFTMFVVKHVYYNQWVRLIENYEEFHEKYFKGMKAQCSTIEKGYWALQIEGQDFFIT